MSPELALGTRRARGFALIGELILVCTGLATAISMWSFRFFVLTAITMLVIAGAVRLGEIADGRFFKLATHTTMAVMLTGTIYSAIKLGYGNPLGVTFGTLIILAANYILGARAAVFWTTMAVLGVSYALLTSERIPYPTGIEEPSTALVLASRVVVLVGCCAIATAERRFSDRQSRELEQLARYDSLTGLLNRRGFQLRLRDSLARARRHGRRVGLIFLDLDAFKAINDAHGHAVGDALLQDIGTHIASITREGDAAGRAGGDEFVMLLEDVEESKDVEMLAQRILQQLQGRVVAGVHSGNALGMSIGAACFPDDADDVGSLMHAADLAMYRAKDGGGSAVCIAGS